MKEKTFNKQSNIPLGIIDYIIVLFFLSIGLLLAGIIVLMEEFLNKRKSKQSEPKIENTSLFHYDALKEDTK